MQFKVEQIALCPEFDEDAIELLEDMGLTEWVDDHVTAEGSVYRDTDVINEADLHFNYTALADAKELEVLYYSRGYNWMFGQTARVSHFGMHVTEEELSEWRKFFAKRGIDVVQEVNTTHHTNPAIAGKRYYHYVIFGTYKVLGVDIKFIVRQDELHE